MQLLIKGAGNQGVAAHIPNADGTPLCHTQINLTDWHLVEPPPRPIVICYHCKRAQANAIPLRERTV